MTKGNEMKINMSNEPVAIIGAVVGLVEAIIALLLLFGVALTIEQQAALMAVVVAAGSVISAVWARSLVTGFPPAWLVARLEADPAAVRRLQAAFALTPGRRVTLRPNGHST